MDVQAKGWPKEGTTDTCALHVPSTCYLCVPATCAVHAPPPPPPMSHLLASQALTLQSEVKLRRHMNQQ